MKFFFHITEVVEHYIDPNTGIPITVEQLQAMYQHQQQPEVMYTEDGQPIQQVWPQQQVRVPASSTSHALFWSTCISWSIFYRDLACMNSIVTCSIKFNFTWSNVYTSGPAAVCECWGTVSVCTPGGPTPGLLRGPPAAAVGSVCGGLRHSHPGGSDTWSASVPSTGKIAIHLSLSG